MNRERDSRVLRAVLRYCYWFRFVSFGVCERADASTQTRDRIVPSSVPLGEGPDFKSWPKKRRSNAYKPIGLSRNSNRTAIRYSGDLPPTRRAACVALPAPHRRGRRKPRMTCEDGGANVGPTSRISVRWAG